LDHKAGINSRRLRPAAEQLATRAGGTSASFDKACQLLDKMAGVRLSESTVERTTQDVGQRIATLQDQGIPLGPDIRWRWHRDAQGRRGASVPLDARGPRQQGPGGRHADGCMA